jgi:hypothetical protein
MWAETKLDDKLWGTVAGKDVTYDGKVVGKILDSKDGKIIVKITDPEIMKILSSKLQPCSTGISSRAEYSETEHEGGEA